MERANKRISVFGLGYVGSVSSACFAGEGFQVIGIDPQSIKVDLINRGQTPIIEPGLGELISDAVGAGHLRATLDVNEAIAETDISVVCVGTPSQPNGDLAVDSVLRVCREIGSALADKDEFHVVAIRSTILPGTMRNVILPTLETASGKKAGVHFGLCNNPEFLRESTAIEDFRNPPKTVIGAMDERSSEMVAALYADIEAPMVRTSIEIAEMVKYADNAWHGLKVAFGNEMGNICKALSIDSHDLMEIFCQDTKLNLSSYYLKPGFAFGGSCLPKDLRALTYKARRLDLSLPVLESILPSNRIQVERAIQIVTAKGHRKVGVLGFSFKAGTDDLRESPLVELIERLIGKGYDLRLYDSNVKLASILGANREYILKSIPHISTLMMDTIEGVLEHGDVIIVGNGDARFGDVASRLRPNQVLVDMIGVPGREALTDRYDGVNW